MRRSSVTIGGKAYPMCFSLRVVKACWDRYGSLDGMFSAIRMRTSPEGGASSPVDESLWMLETLLDAGRRYGGLNGEEDLGLPDRDALLDMMDAAEIQKVILTAISADSGRTVEAEPPKNGGSGADLPES